MFVETVDTGVCASYTTLYTEYYEVWKLLHYSVYRGLSPLPGGRLFVIWKAFHLGGLAVHQSVQGGSFVNFLGLVSYKGDCRQMHSQSLILKTKGALRKLVILRYLWEQICILYTLTKLPAKCMNFDPKSVFNAWRMWACTIPLEVAGSVSGKVGSHEQVDLPIHRLQH